MECIVRGRGSRVFSGWRKRGFPFLGRTLYRVAAPMGLFTDLTNTLTEGVKVNAAWCEQRNGRDVWFKRRRRAGGPILAGANAFFRLAGAPIRALGSVPEWQRWEIQSFNELHGGEGYSAFAEGARGVGAEAVPGVNMTEFLDGGAMTPPMAAAAARELRRAHALGSRFFAGGWSHGDAHAGNFVYDPPTERARLIDFELRHCPWLSTAERQYDDLLGFLLDMVGRIEAERWLPCASAFLLAYDDAAVAERIVSAAPAPRGLSGLWLRVRTTFLAPEELRRRWSGLRQGGQ
jgi:hypothetical protein